MFRLSRRALTSLFRNLTGLTLPVFNQLVA